MSSVNSTPPALPDLASARPRSSSGELLERLKTQLQNVVVRNEAGCLSNGGSTDKKAESITRGLAEFLLPQTEEDRRELGRSSHVFRDFSKSGKSRQSMMDDLVRRIENSDSTELSRLAECLHYSASKRVGTADQRIKTRVEVLVKFGMGASMDQVEEVRRQRDNPRQGDSPRISAASGESAATAFMSVGGLF